MNAAALLLALMAREHCMADSARDATAPAKSDAGLQKAVSAGEKDTLRENIFGLAEGGSPGLALEKASARPDVFTPRDLLLLEHLVVAQQVRWARQQASVSNDPDRLLPAERALAGADSLLARIPPDEEYDGVWRAARSDRLMALSVRGRMIEAATLYERLLKESDTLPAGAYVAGGDAYAYMDKPDLAAHAYERALLAVSEPLPEDGDLTALSRADVQERLFFAYLDGGHFEAAHAVIDTMARTTPITDPLSEDNDKVNPKYGRVRKLQAQYLLYTNRVHDGVQALEALRKDAPFDPTLLSARADGSMVQERPYASMELYRQSLADHPADLESLVGVGKAALELRQYDQAKQVATVFDSSFPDSVIVKNFQRDYDVYLRPQLIIDANGQRGNTVLADHAWSVDTLLYSSPMFDYWRIFAHQYSGQADTGDGLSVSRIRNGAGAEYRRDAWIAAAEVHQSTGGSGKTGGTGSISLVPDDHLRLTAVVDSDDNSLPWKAYQAGVTGRSATVSARYSVDDSRYFNLRYMASRYSDSNLHQEWQGTAYQRVLNQPRHVVAIWLDMGSNSNTLSDVAYFNPHRESVAQVRAMYEWTPWRYAQKSFSQRVYATAGGYRQDGFGTSMLWELRLEQFWRLGRKASLSYGIGVGSQRYDATRETTKLIYLNLNVPL